MIQCLWIQRTEIIYPNASKNVETGLNTRRNPEGRRSQGELIQQFREGKAPRFWHLSGLLSTTYYRTLCVSGLMNYCWCPKDTVLLGILFLSFSAGALINSARDKKTPQTEWRKHFKIKFFSQLLEVQDQGSDWFHFWWKLSSWITEGPPSCYVLLWPSLGAWSGGEEAT